jgi:hypothetical protein
MITCGYLIVNGDNGVKCFTIPIGAVKDLSSTIFGLDYGIRLQNHSPLSG